MKNIKSQKKLFIITFLMSVLFFISFIIPFHLFSNMDEILTNQQETFLEIHDTNSGMFAVFAEVLGALDLYETGVISGLKVNFNSGLYFDPAHGDNWWEYFFEPIDMGNKEAPQYIPSSQEGIDIAQMGLRLNKHRAYELIQKYIHLKPHIQDEIDLFVKEHFDQKIVIGVHHRGTDKVIEWPIISFQNTFQLIIQTIGNIPSSDRTKVRIFVATDDQHFLTFIKKTFRSFVIHNDFVRSTDSTPLHYDSHNYFQAIMKKERRRLLTAFCFREVIF